MPIPAIVIRIFGKNDLGKSLSAAQKQIGKTGKKMQAAGRKMTLGLSAPLALAGIASFKMANDFNQAMANVGTLIPGDLKRLRFLKAEVQKLAIETGKSTADVSEGLFQVISAFGDGPETMAKLRTNARAAVGGVADVADAINLTSLVTKAYGDTTAEATQKVLNLAFNANKLGQTTFPEMAATLGKAIPFAKNLGVTLETVFGIMGTFTGVTGNTSEVVTQLTGLFGALLKPTGEMEQLFKALGVSGGSQLIKKFGGLRQAMNAIDIFAKKNNKSLGKLLGRKEALNLVLAATGAQADTFAIKLGKMNEVTGLAEEAFRQQADGINKNGFAFKQFTQQVAVLGQQLGDTIGQSLSPFITKLGKITAKFSMLSPGTKKFIVIIGGLIAVLGPLLLLLGGVAIAVAAISWPVLAVVAGIALLAAGIALVILKWKTWGFWIKSLATLFLVFLGPIGLVIGAVILLGQHWDKIIAGFKIGFKWVSKIGGIIGKFLSAGGSGSQGPIPNPFGSVGNSFNTGAGGVPNASQVAAQAVGGTTNTNNAKIEMDFVNMPDFLKPKVTKNEGPIDLTQGLMGQF